VAYLEPRTNSRFSAAASHRLGAFMVPVRTNGSQLVTNEVREVQHVKGPTPGRR
jgi:hypothetical protein